MNPSHFIGRIIGKYKIKEKIGEGSFSVVFLAEEVKIDSDDFNDNNKMKEKKKKQNILKKITKKLTRKANNKRYAACKVIPKKKLKDEKKKNNLYQEIRIYQQMHHPNVVQLLDIKTDSEYYYIFLEFCPCGELYQYLGEKGILTEYEAAIFLKQLLIGLQYIHSLNVGHRDLKPENILIDESGKIKISDFGLSKLLKNDGYGLTKTPCGSPCYVSPECVSGRPYDPRKNDIWSCGVILFEMTTGKLPWTKGNQKKLFQQIRNGDYSVPGFLSEQCSDLICRLMTVDIKKRITINEALNHPFLKEVPSLPSKFDPKFVSLRKVDRLIGNDEDFEYNDMNIFQNKKEFESQSAMNFLQIRKYIETDDDKKREREKLKDNQIQINDNEKDDCTMKQKLDSNHEEKKKKNNKKNKFVEIIEKITHKKNNKRKNASIVPSINQNDSKLSPANQNILSPLKKFNSHQIPMRIIY